MRTHVLLQPVFAPESAAILGTSNRCAVRKKTLGIARRRSAALERPPPAYTPVKADFAIDVQRVARFRQKHFKLGGEPSRHT